MFERSDKQFADALENPELMEKHLGELDKQRQLNAVLFIITSVVFLGSLFHMVFLRGAGNISAADMLLPATALFLCLSQCTAIHSAQASIRTLKAFKKTSELLSSRNNRA